MEQWWKNYPWRMIQTNLREIDMEDINAEVFVEDLKSFNANVVLINTGGIIASYQTHVEDHFQSEYLHGDSLSRMIHACHDAGIKVIARMDFSKVRRPIYEKHPDWAYRTIDGEIVDYNGDVHVCVCGGYQQKKAFEIIQEVIETLPVDGMFINMGGFQVRDYSYHYHGICHCENCMRQFRKRFGIDLPRAEDMKDPAFRKYRVFQREVLAEYRDKLDWLIHDRHPNIVVDGIDFIRHESNTEYKRPLPFWQYSAASNTRTLRGIDGRMVSSNTSVDFIGFFYRHVAVNPEEQELRLWQDVANFGGIDYYLMGRLDNHEDQSGFEKICKVFAYCADHEQEYINITSKAEVLLTRGERWGIQGEERGWIRALSESHILFDEIELMKIRPEHDLSKYKAIILPGTEAIPSWLAARLDEFAAHGGCVIASGTTGIYDGDYAIHEKYPLKCMGVKQMLYKRTDMVSAMLHVEREDLAVLPSYQNCRVLYLGDDFTFYAYEKASKGYLRLIPPQRFGPPERCYTTQVTDIHGVQVTPWGKGKGVMIPWMPGLLYYRDGYANTYRFMRDMLLNVADVHTVEEAGFSPMVEVSVGQAVSGSHMLIQLVNNTGHFGTSYLEPVPVYDIALKVPCERQPAEVFSQIRDEQIPFRWEQGLLRVTVHKLDHFEGLLVKF